MTLPYRAQLPRLHTHTHTYAYTHLRHEVLEQLQVPDALPGQLREALVVLAGGPAPPPPRDDPELQQDGVGDERGRGAQESYTCGRHTITFTKPRHSHSAQKTRNPGSGAT